MGFKDKLTKHFSDAYIDRYGDRMTSASGTVLSIKSTEKSILGILKSITISIVIKPEQSKQIVKCEYKKKRWFKKPEFIDIKQGHKLIIMGLKGEKGKENSEVVSISNVANLTTKKDLQPFDHEQIKKARKQATRMKAR